MSLGLYLAIARVQISKHDHDLTSSTLLPIVGEVCTTSFIRLGEGERGRGGRGRGREREGRKREREREGGEEEGG